MTKLITISRLSRRLDVSIGLLHRRVRSNHLKPVAITETGVPMFDADLLEQYRQDIVLDKEAR